MTDMVERVARAIEDSYEVDSGFDLLNITEVARAAIEAMREPTNHQTGSGQFAFNEATVFTVGISPNHITIIYSAMINAALNNDS